MSHRVSSVSLSPRITRVTISRFGDSGYSHPAPSKATLIGALRKAMNRLSALILNTYFPAFSHKGCVKSTFSVAVREILKKDLWDEDKPVQFVPDGWVVNRRRREFCILEIEDTNSQQEALSETTVFDGIHSRLFSGISRFEGVTAAGCKCHRQQ